VKIKYSNPQKAHLCRKTRLINVERWRFIRRRDLWGSRRKQKKRKEERKKDTRNSGKLSIRPDHPRRRIKIKICMVGGLRCVVIHVKCDPNRLRGYDTVGCRKWPFPITLASGLYSSLYYRTSRDTWVTCDASRVGVVIGVASVQCYSASWERGIPS